MLKNLAVSWLLASSGSKFQDFNSTSSNIWSCTQNFPAVQHAYFFDAQTQIKRNISRGIQDLPFRFGMPPNKDIESSPTSIQWALTSIANSFGTAKTRIQNLASRIDRMLSNFSLPAAEAVKTDEIDNDMEKYSYNKGDSARDIDEFRLAVKNDYAVFSNPNAYNPKLFNKKAIFIYGDHYCKRLIPSIRNGQGILLYQSDNLNICLKKHRSNPENICKNINLPESNGISDALKFAHQAGAHLLSLLDPTKYSQLRAEIHYAEFPRETVAIISEIFEFIDSNYNRIYNSHTSLNKTHLEQAKEYFYHCTEKFNDLVDQTSDQAKFGFAKEATKIIKKLEFGKNTAIMVNNLDTIALYSVLNDNFPDHAVIGCYLLCDEEKAENEGILKILKEHTQSVKRQIENFEQKREL